MRVKITDILKDKKLVILFGILIGFSGYSGWKAWIYQPKIEVAILIANADSNRVSFQRRAEGLRPKTREDSLRLGQAQFNMMYWRGVGDAFRVLNESSVRVK